MTAVCNKCSTLLDDTNWNASYQKNMNRICKHCFNSKFNSKNNKINNPLAMYVNNKYISRKHPLYKPGRYKTFNDAAFECTYKANSIKEGYVYVISNRAWPDWVKIGMAIDAEDRLNGYQTSSPYRDYTLEHKVYSANRRESEREAHTKAAVVCKGNKGEWFKMSVEQAITILDNLNEHGHVRTPTKADTHKEEDNLQGSLF
jgi:hypothetical protein